MSKLLAKMKKRTAGNRQNSPKISFQLTPRNRVIGWAFSPLEPAKTAVVEIRSRTNTSYLVADRYRKDLIENQIHPTGLCGFEANINEWPDKKLKARVVGVIDSQSGQGKANALSDLPTYKPESPVFFIHIPKTAGSSFRFAMQDYIGATAIEKNYGPLPSETTPMVDELILQKADYFELYRRMVASGSRMYTGHVHAFPMAFAFPLIRVVTIVREPVAQIVSHFHHQVNWNNFKGSFEEFVRNSSYRNLQTRVLNQIPIQLIGFIGVTEEFEQSILLFNNAYNFHLKAIRKNVNEKEKIQLDDEKLTLITAMNQLDIQLYKKVTKLFHQRLDLFRKGLPFCHGAIQVVDDKQISGFACWSDSEKPVQLELVCDDKFIAETEAVQIRPALSRFILPRRGFIGFQFDFSGLNTADLSVRVKSTGQELFRDTV